MELRQLRYFVTVAKTLNFSEAAKSLFITQGTLSQQIKQLEDELGSELFVRSSHKVSLTEAGAEMLPLAQNTLEDSAECFQRITDLKKGVSGTLNIGLTTSFRGILNNALKIYLKEYPNVKLQIVYHSIGELISMLKEHEIDFFIAFKSAVLYDEIDTFPLVDSELCAVMSKDHPLAGRETLTLQELERQRIILPSSGLQSRKAFDRFVDADTSSLNICVEINNPHGIIKLVHSTNLIAIMSSLATYYDPTLVAIPIEGMRRKMVGCVHTLKGSYVKKSSRLFFEVLNRTT
ncbi:MAG: LysR family transcriptional regulator [Bacteroidales bacterium]|nr:LysR family transcriptional regulator [Bacteroidales bacterium]